MPLALISYYVLMTRLSLIPVLVRLCFGQFIGRSSRHLCTRHGIQPWLRVCVQFCLLLATVSLSASAFGTDVAASYISAPSEESAAISRSAASPKSAASQKNTAGNPSTADNQEANASELLSVVTTIRPLALIANDILGATGDARALVATGDSPHHYSLTPSARLAVAKADLLLWIGPGFEVNLATLFAGEADRGRLVTVSDIQGLTLHSLGEEHGHSGESGTHAQQLDLHVWLDPNNAVRIAAAVAAAATSLNPAAADSYAQRLAQFQSEQAQQSSLLSLRAQEVAAQPYLVYHDAYRYLEELLGINHAAALLNDPERAPSIRELSALRSTIASTLPVCLVTEPGADGGLISTALAGHTLPQVELDVLGAGVPDGQSGYARFLKSLAEPLLGCLSQA